MIRNVILMATSGLVLFSKEFVNAVAQPRMVGSLITAMIEFSIVTTGMPVSYIELPDVAVSIVTNDVAKVFCALFHDQDDGPAFGRLIAMEILLEFVTQYSRIIQGHMGHNLKDFQAFHNNVFDVIRNSVRPMMNKLQMQRGVHKAVLVTDDAVEYATVEIDQLGILANLQALLGLSTDIMAFIDDSHCIVHLGGATTNIEVWQIERSTLIVLCSKSVSQAKLQAGIKEAVQMLRKVCVLVSNLHLASR